MAPFAQDEERLRRLQSLTDAALAHLDLDALLAELLVRARDLLDADTAACLLLEEETNDLVARAAVGLEEEVERGVRIPVGRGFAGRIAATRQPVVLDDVDHADVLNPLLREKGIKSLLGVPLGTGPRPIGVLHVGTLTHRRFTQSDVELLQLVGTRLALAIERARLHAEIVELDQLKLNFVAIASHELRTPAASVYGTLATLAARDDSLAAETRRQLLELGLEQGERLRRLIEQLLDLSRLDAKGITVEPRPLPLAETLAEIAAHAAPETEVHVDAPAGVTALADPLVLDRVVSNLLANAVKHGEPPVRLGARVENDALLVTVEDAGRGIPSELVPRLFERFARGESNGGSGLGLAIAAAYAEAAGGTLAYARDENGTRFALTLPHQA